METETEINYNIVYDFVKAFEACNKCNCRKADCAVCDVWSPYQNPPALPEYQVAITEYKSMKGCLSR